jgi:hypothetical protein
MDTLKEMTKNSPAIQAIGYPSDCKVILAVDTSRIAVGYILSQMGIDNRRYPSRFGSLTLSDRESRYSQAKLELFGLFHALKDCRIWIIGILANSVVEVDAKYIKGMINDLVFNPMRRSTDGLQPSSSLIFAYDMFQDTLMAQMVCHDDPKHPKTQPTILTAMKSGLMSRRTPPQRHIPTPRSTPMDRDHENFRN